MISVPEALEHVLSRAAPLPPERVPLRDALGLVLAEDIVSDVDSPPHDKAMVDGYAVRSADFARRARGESEEDVDLAIVEEVTAGEVPQLAVETGRATRIMTGAPIPEGADAVVMVEQTEHLSEPFNPLGVVRFPNPDVLAGQHIMTRAMSMRTGQIVLTSGSRVRAIEIGLLAEVGRAEVNVVPRPRVAVLPTGNELVPPEFQPAAGQLRNSNGPMLTAAITQAGGVPLDLGIGRDDPRALTELIQRGLEADVLVISGGVSAGTMDLVPDVLEQLGVKQVFHKVQLKPGKPLWFGVWQPDDAEASDSTLVFGLPGNPVSSLVCCQLFVAPAVAKISGRGDTPQLSTRAALAVEFTQRGNRPTYHPARLRVDTNPAIVEPLAWAGSADLHTLSSANALVRFPAGEQHFAAGEIVECLPLGDSNS